MELVYIGKNYHLGLEHGKTYEVLFPETVNIRVFPKGDLMRTVIYKEPFAFLRDWRRPEDMIAPREPDPDTVAHEKALKDYTLGEVQNICKGYDECSPMCKFYSASISGCRLYKNPFTWELRQEKHFTEQEVEKAKSIRILFPEADTVAYETGMMWLKCGNERYKLLGQAEMFPSIKEGESVKVTEIIGEE